MPLFKTVKLKKSALIFWTFSVITGFAIYLLSSQSGEETAGVSSGISEWIARFLFGQPSYNQIEQVHYIVRQLARIVVFTGFGFFTAEAVYVTFTKVNILILFTLSALFCSVLAFFDEWRKQFINGRHFQPDEALMNILSVIVGALIAFFVLKIFQKIFKK